MALAADWFHGDIVIHRKGGSYGAPIDGGAKTFIAMNDGCFTVLVARGILTATIGIVHQFSGRDIIGFIIRRLLDLAEGTSHRLRARNTSPTCESGAAVVQVSRRDWIRMMLTPGRILSILV